MVVRHSTLSNRMTRHLKYVIIIFF